MDKMQFYYDVEKDEFYIVNFQEELYVRVANEGSMFYKLFSHMYCSRWNNEEEKKATLEGLRRVYKIEEIDGSFIDEFHSFQACKGNWITREGEVLEIEKMTALHIQNSLEMIKRICNAEGINPHYYNIYDDLKREYSKRKNKLK